MLDEGTSLVAEVARALGGMIERVVFIGGAVAPLLQADRPFRAPRPTDDVDAIAATLSYTDFERMCGELRQLGFREPSGATHAHRWTTPGPNEVKFDLIPVGDHLAGSGNPWELAAMESAVRFEIEPGLIIRHASGPGFLALKLAAFRDRGREDPRGSTDLEDIFALVASRPQIVQEIAAAPDAIREFAAARLAAILAMEEFEDLIASHLGNVARSRAATVIPATEARLRAIAQP
jgi:predicted nucleotidyltransferase